MSLAVRRALYGRMSADTALNNLLATPPSGYAKSIYYQQAPANAAFPYVLFSKQSGTPTDAFGDPGTLDTYVWLVKGVDSGTSADAAEGIQARLRVLLNDASLSISGLTHLFLRRQSDVDYSEVSDGVPYVHAGSLFRLVTT